MPSFSDSPLNDATAAAVFWSPEQSPHVLSAIAVPASSRPQTQALGLADLQCQVRVLEAPDRPRLVLFQDTARSLQLAVAGVSVLQPVGLLVDAMVRPDRLRAHLGALDSLNALHATGRLPLRCFPPEPRSPRLAVVLQALDGSLAGAPYREIAAGLIGHARAEAEWRDPGDYLRDRTRRAVRRGHALMEGGYRQFLR